MTKILRNEIKIDRETIEKAKLYDEESQLLIIKALNPIIWGYVKNIPKEWKEDGKQSAICGILLGIERFDFKRSDETMFISFVKRFIGNEISTLRRTVIDAAVKIPHNVKCAIEINKKSNSKKKHIQLTNGMKIRVEDVERFQDCVSFDLLTDDQLSELLNYYIL